MPEQLRVDPHDLENLEEWAAYLESILNGNCTVWEEDGALILLEIKALVERIRGLRIEIFPRDHTPPHFHVHSSSVAASFRIDDCSLINGEISSDDYKRVRYWHQHAKQLLIEKWNSTRPSDCTVGPYKE